MIIPRHPHVPRARQTPLESFGAAISSATDLDLAAWQELGIANPRSADGRIIWSIIGASVVMGLGVLGVGAWIVVGPLLGLLPAATSNLNGRGAGMLLLAGGLMTLTVGAAASFGSFQGLSRVVFAMRHARC